MYYTIAVVDAPISKAYEQFLATGVVGAVALLAIYGLIKLYRAKEEQRKNADTAYNGMVRLKDEMYNSLVKLKNEQEENFRKELQQLSKDYHAELKDVAQQLMDLMREKSASETKVTEVLHQVVSVQSDVERTLNRFLDQFDGGSKRGGFPTDKRR